MRPRHPIRTPDADAGAAGGQLLDRMRDIVGAAHLLTDLSLRSGYEIDWTGRFRGTALAVARPGSTAEVAALLVACAAAGVAVVPQGGNSGLVGGGVPRGGEIVISLSRLRRLDAPDPAAAAVTSGAGVTLGELQRHAATAGWEFGVDLGARDSATIGGMIATNAGGIHVLRHGPMRRQVVGIEAVLADGSIVSRLTAVEKDSTGYDLAGLMCGSEGTLGIVTAARLRLVPALRRRTVALIGLAGIARAVELAASLRRQLDTLLAAELFAAEGLQLVTRHTARQAPFAAPVYLLIELGSAATGPVDLEGDLAAALGDREATDVAIASHETGRRRLWELRERHTEAVNAESVSSGAPPHKLDVALPTERLTEFIERVGAVASAARAATRTIVYGHVCDGNLHVNLLGPAADDERPDDAVLGLVLELGGSISAEHGIGVAKRRWLVADRGAADVAAMRSIKRALDPKGMLNPGVLLPDT